MISLPPAIQRWITMLQTTQLPQGFETLHVEDPVLGSCYCGLGILCLANGKSLTSDDGGGWAYIEEILGHEGARQAYRKNDDDRLTFPQIAAWAEVYFSDHGPHTQRSPSP